MGLPGATAGFAIGKSYGKLYSARAHVDDDTVIADPARY
jgi:hypothetical protein